MTKLQNRRRSKTGALLITLIVLLGLGAVAATVYIANGFQVPWKSPEEVKAQEAKKAAEDHTGKVHVPVLVRTVPPYTALELDLFTKPDNGEASVQWVSAEVAKQAGLITEFKNLRGRVTAREKRADYGFTESDLLPPGSPARPSAAVPAGMRGMYVPTEKVQGLTGLALGDEVDLVATKSVDAARDNGGDTISPEEARREAEERPWSASTRVLVRAAKVILPAPEKKGGVGKSEAYLAIPEADYDTFLEALAKSAQISALTHSSSPAATAQPLPSPDKDQGPDVIQVLHGSSTTTVKLSPAKDGAEPR